MSYKHCVFTLNNNCNINSQNYLNEECWPWYNCKLLKKIKLCLLKCPKGNTMKYIFTLLHL